MPEKVEPFNKRVTPSEDSIILKKIGIMNYYSASMEEDYMMKLKEEAAVLKQLCYLLSRNTEREQAKSNVEKKTLAEKDNEDSITEKLASLELIDEVLSRAHRVRSGHNNLEAQRAHKGSWDRESCDAFAREDRAQKLALPDKSLAISEAKRTGLQGVRRRLPEKTSVMSTVASGRRGRKAGNNKRDSSKTVKGHVGVGKGSIPAEHARNPGNEFSASSTRCKGGPAVVHTAVVLSTPVLNGEESIASEEKDAYSCDDSDILKLRSLQARNRQKFDQFNRLRGNNLLSSKDFVKQLEESFQNDATFEDFGKLGEEFINDKRWLSMQIPELSRIVQSIDAAELFSSEFVHAMELLDVFADSQGRTERSEMHCKDLQLMASRMVEMELLHVTTNTNMRLLEIAESAIMNPEVPKRDKLRVYRLAYGQICGQGKAFPSMVKDYVADDKYEEAQLTS